MYESSKDTKVTDLFNLVDYKKGEALIDWSLRI